MSEERLLSDTASGDHPAVTDALRGMFSRDFIYLVVSALPVVLTAAVTPILTRRLGVAEYGQFALALVVMQILGPIFSFGLPFATQKVFAGEDGPRRARGVLAVSAVLAVAAGLVAALVAPVWGPAVGLYRVLDARLAAVWAVSYALAWTSVAMLRSRDNSMGMVIVVVALESLGAQACGLALLYWWAPTITSYICGVIIGQGAAALVGLLALRPDWSALAKVRGHGRAILFGLPMVPQQLSAFILYAGDRIVVRHDLGSAATGRYSVAYNVGSLAVILLVFANQAWMPRVYAVTDRVARSRLLASSRDMLNLLLVPLVCGLAAGAPVALRIWAPRSFDPGGLTSIVAIVAISTFPYGQSLSNVRALMSEGRTDRAAMATMIAAAVNIALNIVMVPFLGITGSAIATVLSLALLARLTRPPAKSGLQVPGVPRRIGALIGGGVAATLLMGVLPTSPWWLAVRLMVCAGAALAFVLLMRRAASGFETSDRFLTQAADAAPLSEESAERWDSSPSSPDIAGTWVFQPLIEEFAEQRGSSPDDTATLVFQPSIRLRKRGRRRIRWTAALAVVVLPVLGFVSYKFASGVDTAAAPSVTPSVHASTAHARPTRPVAARVLTPASVTAFGPGGGDDPQQAALAVSGNPATPWHTDWYTTPYFGNLYAGTGLLLDMGRTIRVTSVRLSLGSARGAELQLRAGGSPVLADLHTVATSSGAGDTVELSLTSSAHARYLLIWFTKLPPDHAGTYQASIYEITVKGRP
jgi:O-antigen/teichoic acid export membrane protein